MTRRRAETLSGAQINLRLSQSGIEALDANAGQSAQEAGDQEVKRGTIRGRGPESGALPSHAIAAHDINFGIGPAGTGKTYLAVADGSGSAEPESRTAPDPGSGPQWQPAKNSDFCPAT